MGNTESSTNANDSEETTTTTTTTTTSQADDEPRWNEIEHENLLLEQLAPLPDITSNRKTFAVMSSAEQQKDPDPESDLSLEEFREQLANKRLARQTAVQDLREEIQSLRKQLQTAQAENRRLRQGASVDAELPQAEEPQAELSPAQAVDEDDANPSSRSRHANIELANAQLALQLANAENLSLRGELDVVQRQVATLKEVICCCKQMLSVKEEQCAQLKMKLTEIENSFSEREMKIMSNNLRQEYERQLVNIRQLRQLYEERQRVAAAEYENLQRLISIKKDELIAEQEKTKNFEERNQLLNKELETANEELAKLREECAEHKFEKRILKEQVAAVNLLFSQLVMGFNGEHNMNIDRLTQMLEENRDLLNEMTLAEGSCSDGATLPKLLFELVEQATSNQTKRDKSRSATPVQDEVSTEDSTDNSVRPEPSARKLHRRRGESGDSGATAATLKCHEPEIMGKVATAQEIIGNLPKVWKVLMELLSHHKIERVQFEEMPTAATTTGAGAGATASKAPELSVSKTYIKLKDLIMEKKSLVKETNRLKTLNSHLDNRLNEQEKRLSVVSLELTKTWHLVGKMQRQHRQLHTQEQILRYQLQQKRRLLSELKDELDYCRRKWALARAKNDESQELCNDWRREFARRKLEDANHSAESGYSDSGPQSDEEAAVSVSACRRKHLRDQFEHTRKIKRMQSTSPGRQEITGEREESVEIVLRWNSAPPTCGWRDEPEESEEQEAQAEENCSRGAVPKTIQTHSSRSRQRGSSGSSPGAATERIQKLEEQCKSLIQQVLETSGNRERLEIQLCRFQDEISPAQHAVPLDEFINRKRLERMTRASSAPATGSLTPREEEYTRKRSERLGRLEEESRQLLSRIKRTADRGHYLKKSLDRIRRAPSREGSFESNTEEEAQSPLTVEKEAQSPLTVEAQSPLKLEKEAQSPLTVKKEAQSLLTVEKEAQSPLTLEKEAQSPLTVEKEAQSPLTVEKEAQSPLTLEKEAQSPLTVEKEAQSPLTVEKEAQSPLTVEKEAQSPLTLEEQAYTSRRAARLQRLEQESQQLLSQLARNTERGESLVSRLDTLHEQSQSQLPSVSSISLSVEQRLEDIERVSANRAERLRRLEQQGNELITRLSNTSERGTAMINRIAERQANRRQEALLLEQTTAEEATSCFVDNNNDMASSCIVEQEMEESQGAACCVTVTTTSAQLAIQQSTGAIPKTTTKSKSKPLTQLCAALRHDDATKKRSAAEQAVEEESLESMVQRLRAIPYPEERVREQSSGEQEGAKKEETKMEELREKELKEEEKANRENVGVEISRQKELREKVIKKEIPKEEGPKEEGLKVEEPKVEEPKEEEPKMKGAKEEGPKMKGAKEEGPKEEGLTEEGPMKEGPKEEGPKEKGRKEEGPKVEEPKAEGPKAEGPQEEGPTANEPKEKGDTDKGAKEVEAAKKMEEDIKKEESKEKEPKEEKSKEEESKEEEFTEELPKEQDLKKQGAKEEGTQEREPKQQTSQNVDFKAEEQMEDEEPKKEEPKEQEHKKQGAKEEESQEMEPILKAAEEMEPKERELKEEEPKEEEPKAEESNKE
ncbi:hypothetical protein ACLKA7_004745 [Drosophila subpalustris]